MNCLPQEHPRVVALILTHLPVQVASETLRSFEPTQRVSILRRLCRNEKFNRDEIARLSASIWNRMRKKLLDIRNETDGVETASRLLSCLDVSTRENLLQGVNDDAQLLGDLKSRMLTFDSLKAFGDDEIKTILARTDTSLWAPALTHARREIRKKIFDNLAERPMAILKAEIRQASHVDILVGSTAQAEIVSVILGLIDAKLIQPLSTRKRAA